MAKSIGALYVDLSVKNGMSKALSAARGDLARFGKASMKWGALAAGAASAAMVAGTKRAISMGADLDHLSTQTGIAASSLMRIGQMYKDNGRDAKSAGKDIGKMQKAIVDAARDPNTAGNDYFKELGLNAQDLLDLSPEQQFLKIGDAIKTIENPTQRAALAMGIFGKAGAGLVTVFQGSNLDDVNKSLGKMPEIMDQFSGAMERADTLMGRLPNKSDQFFTGFTSGVIGQLLPSLEKANDFDFTTMGQNLGISIGTAFEMLTDGTLVDVIGLKLSAGLIDAAMKFADSLQAGVYASVEYLRSMGSKSFGDAFKHAMGVNATAAKGSSTGQMTQEMREEADRLYNKALAGNAAKMKAASGIGNNAGRFGADGGVAPASSPSFSSGESKKKDVDEFLKRGLVVGGMGKKDDEEKKQTKILTRMLAKMESKLPDLEKEAVF